MKRISVAFKLVLIILISIALSKELFAGGLFRAEAFYYFTIQSNVLVLFSLMLFLFMHDNSGAKRIIRGVVLLAITLTGIIYNCVLYKLFLDWGTEGYTFSRTTTHLVAPIGYLADWLLFDQHNGMKWKHIFIWLLYPLSYCAYSVFLSIKGSKVIYFFFDLSSGYMNAMKWIGVLLCMLILIGFIYVGIDKLFYNKEENRSK